MPYWLTFKKSFNLGTYLLRKQLIPKTLQKTLIINKICTFRKFKTKLTRCTFYT